MKNTLAKHVTAGRVIRLPQVVELTAASRATVWRWVKDDPTFPKPFHLSEGVTVWDEREIFDWLDGGVVEMWMKPNFDGILPELKDVPNWVLAKAVVRDGKTTKPPFQPNGKPASHSDPSTWSSFADAKKAYERGGYIGVGFVLDGKPHFNGCYLHGFDWDHCIDDGGVLDPVVAAEIEKLAIPRIEKSISGTGIRGFFLHDEALPSRKIIKDGRSVEIYSNSRYLTTTGVDNGVLA